MSDKLTEQKIEEMIAELLKEFSLNPHQLKKRELDDKLKSNYKKGEYQSLARTAPNTNILDDKDIETALSKDWKLRNTFRTQDIKNMAGEILKANPDLLEIVPDEEQDIEVEAPSPGEIPVENPPEKSEIKIELSPNEDWEYNLSNVPNDLKNLILLAFNKITEPVKAIAAMSESVISEDKSMIEWEDFYTILKNPNNDLHRSAIKAIMMAKNRLNDENPHRKTLEKISKSLGIEPKIAGKQQDSQIPTVDIASVYGQERKQVPKHVVDLFNNLKLSGAKSVTDRIKILNNMTQKITTGEFEKSDASMGELISVVAVAGLMARIAKLMDNKAAGWAFESFLAQLVNGTTEGSSMGAADFIYGIGEGDRFPPGALGSAKLISTLEFSQSLGTIGDAIGAGQSIYYIVGLKKGDSKKTAKTKDISQVELHLVEVKRIKGKKGTKPEYSDLKYGALGSPNKQPSKNFSISDQTRIGTIYFNKDLETLETLSAAAMQKVNKDLPSLFRAMNGFKNKTESYLSSGLEQSGQKALDDYIQLVSLINSVFGSKAEESGVTLGLKGEPEKTRELKESKLQSIDDLIAETIRDIKKNRK
jgi:hypothetical protein